MKKLLLVSFLALFLMTTAQARDNKKKVIEFGVKLGAMLPTVDFPSSTLAGYDLSADGKMGYQFGLITKINILFLHMQPEVLYTMNRYQLNMSKGDENSTAIIRVNTLDVPVVLGYHLFFFNLNFGPVFTVLTSSSVAKSEGMVDNLLVTKPMVGYMAGISMELKGIVIDARYNGYFKKSEQAFSVSGSTDTFSVGQSNYIFTLGYLF